MKKQLKLFLAITSLSVFTHIGYGQQDAMFTHYMYNTLAVNPAYAGSRHALTVTGISRYQWVGFDGAPVTYSLTAHTPLLHEKLGLGLSFVQDEIGPVQTSTLYADFAYQLQVSEKSRLSFGLKGGFNLRNNALSDVALDEIGDQTFTLGTTSDFLPNFGAGAYYTNDRFYVGVSVPRLLENNSGVGANELFSEDRHYFLIAGGVIDINTMLKFKPTALLKMVMNAPVEADVTASFLLYEKLWLGAMYRTGDAVGLLAGFQITRELVVGYSVDFATTALRSYNSGSHELMLTYDFLYKEKGKIKSPRYF